MFLLSFFFFVLEIKITFFFLFLKKYYNIIENSKKKWKEEIETQLKCENLFENTKTWQWFETDYKREFSIRFPGFSRITNNNDNQIFLWMTEFFPFPKMTFSIFLFFSFSFFHWKMPCKNNISLSNVFCDFILFCFIFTFILSFLYSFLCCFYIK